MRNSFLIVMLMASPLLAAPVPPAKVLVLPFESIGPADKAWIAKAVQQSLVAELSRLNSVQPVSGAAAGADADAAMKVAKEQGAQFVILGGLQSVENDLRITGQVIDVTSGQPVAGLKATGGQRELFTLEDVIAAQVKRALPQPAVAAAEQRPEAVRQPEMLKQPAAPGGAAPGIEPRGPVAIDVARRADQLMDEVERAIDRLRYRARYDDDYYYGYGPRYYPYGYYPWYGYGQVNVAVINNGNDGHHRHHGHHHHNGGNVNRPSSPRPTPRNATVGNFNSMGRMTMQTVRRR